MATGTQPDAGQILNSLINSILLIDPLRQPRRATTARPKLPQIVWYTVTGTVELLLIKYRADARKSGGGARFYR
mgnify:CR=1 FL=1